MKKLLLRSANYLFIAACASALVACGGDTSSSAGPGAQSKQLHRSDKAAASNYSASVQELYVAYFGRPADPAGLANFENELAAANAPTDILGLAQAYATNPRVTALINSFETSPESIALYGNGSTTAFVTSIFQNVLGRTPAASGLSFWVDAINGGSLTQGDAALAIMAGAEKNTTAQGVLDAQLINNRLAVADYFTSQVSAQNIVSSYSGHTAAGVARAMLTSVTASTNVTTFNASNVGTAIASLLAPANVTLDKITLNFAAFLGSGLAPQSINLTIGGGSTTYYGQAVSDQPGVVQATFLENSNTSAIVTVAPLANTPLVTSGSIKIQLCADYACSEVVWSQAIPYTVGVFSVSSTGITIAGYEGTVSPASSIAVVPADTTGQITVSAVTNTGTGWLTASHSTGGNISVGTSGVGLTAGSYQGAVVVSIAGSANNASISVPVSFTVGDGIIAPTASSINLTGTSTPASLTGSANVAFKGTQSPAWSASSDSSWLVLNTASGTGAGAIQYSVNPANLGAVSNWGSTTANITISASGLTSVKVPVTLSESLPEIYSVSPSFVVAGQATTVQVTGRGLSQLSDASQIAVAGVSGVTGTITSDTGAVLNLPALAVGRSTVSVPNIASIATGTGSVGAANLSTMPYSFTAGSGEVPTAIFDPARATLYAVNRSTSTLQRFHYNGSQWQVDGTPVASIGDIAFSPDRGTLYVVSGQNTLLAIDPDSLQTKASYTYTAPSGEPYASIAPTTNAINGLAISNDMKIWFNGDQWAYPTYFDILHGSFGALTVGSLGVNGFLYTPTFFSSGDGSRVLVSQYGGGVTPEDDVYLPASGTLSGAPTAPLAYYLSYSQNGSLMLVNQQSLYNGVTFSLIGTTPAEPLGVTAGVLSPDGTRVYQLASDDQFGLSASHVDIYDATLIQSSTSTLTKLGEIPVTDQAANCGQPYPGCITSGTLVISPLGDTLFWIGDQGLVVFPISSSMSGLQSPVRRLRKAGGH